MRRFCCLHNRNGPTNNLAGRNFQARVGLAAKSELVDGVVVEDDAIVTIARTVVRGGHSVTRGGRVRNEQKADLLAWLFFSRPTTNLEVNFASICVQNR